MPGDAGSAVVKVNFDIQYGNLDGLEARITKLENTPHTIKVKVEAADGQKGLDNLIKGLDNVGQNAFKSTAAGAKSTAKNISSVGKTADKATKKIAGISKEFGQITSDTDEYSSALKAVGKLYDRTAKKMSGMQDASFLDAKSRGNWESLTGYLKQVKELEEDIFNQKTTGQSFNDRYSALANGIQKEISAIHLKNEATSEATKSQAKGLAQQQAFEQKISANRAKAAERSAEAQRVAQAKEKAAQDKAWTDRQSYIKKQEDAWNNQIRQIGKPIEQEIKRQEKIAEAQAKIDAQMNAPIGEDSKARWAAQRQVMADQLRIQKELNSWTAAEKSSKTSGAYATLRESASEMARLNSELEKGTILRKDYMSQYQAAAKAAAKAENTIVKEGKDQLSFGDKLKNAFSSVSRYITPYMVMTKTIQTVKQMAQASMEIESAMTRIQIVTGATDTKMAHFFETASSQAQELGKGITDVAGSIETFSRLGYNLNEATNLSKFANIMANVGDVSVDEATTGITSIIKGFELDASDAEHVSDVLVEVGQKYAISASELMQAFERGGAAMHASGASFEESAALFAATNAALQNSAKTGTLWNTISARMRNSKTELDALGESYDDLAGGFSKYRDEILALSGVDIMKNADEFKNPYQIMQEISSVWDKITGEPAKARLAEIFGGTRQLSGFMSTVTNFKDAMGAYEDAINSAGTASEANSLYMDTTAAHVQKLKAAFQELSYDTFNGNLMKGVVDFGKSSINAIDGLIDRVGVFGTALLSIASSKVIKSFFKNMTDSSNDFEWSLGQTFSKANKGNLAFLGVSAGISAAIGIYQAYKQDQQKKRNAADEDAESFRDLEKSISDSIEQAKQLRTELDSGTLSDTAAYEAKKKLLEIQNQLAESYPSMAEGLDLVNGQMEKQIELSNQLLQKEATEAIQNNRSAYEEAEKYMTSPVKNEYIGMMQTDASVLNDITSKYKDIITWQGNEFGGASFYINGEDPVEAYEKLVTFGDEVTKLRDQIKEDGGNVYDLNLFLDSIEGAIKRLKTDIDDFGPRYNEYKNLQLNQDDKKYKYGGEEAKTAKEWIDQLAKSVDDYNDALLSGDPSKIEETRSAYEASYKAVDTLLRRSKDFSKYSDDVNAVLGRLSEEAVLANEVKEAVSDTRLQPYVNEVKSLGITADRFREILFDTKQHLINSHDVDDSVRAVQTLSSAAGELGITVYDASGNVNEDFVNALINLGAFSDQAAESVEQTISTIDSFSTYQSTLSSALNASASATGLTTEQIDGLKEAYQGIEGFDPNRLFETTANGIHLNQKELQNLNKIIENTKMTQFAKDIKDATDELNKLTDEYGENSVQAKAAQERLDALRREEAQYEGLTSAYNKWQLAQSQTDERASYESVGKGFDIVDNLVGHGWINDHEVDTFLDLVLGKVDAIGNVAKRSGDNLKDFESLSQNIVGGISGTDYGVSVKDLWTYGEDGGLTPGGIQQMLKLANQFDSSIVSINETADGASVKINLMGDNMNRLSQELGLSAEMIQIFERAALDAGADMILDSTNLGLMTEQVESLTQNNEVLSKQLSGIDWSNVENWNTDEIQDAIDALNSSISDLESNAEGAGDEIDILRTTAEALQNQQIRTEVNTQIASGKTYDELLGMSDEDIQATFHVEADGVDEVRAQIAELKAEAESTSITVSIEESQFNELTGGGEETEKTATVKYKKDTSEIDGYDPGEKSATVRYGKDTSLPDGWQPKDKSATVTYQMNKPPVPSYPNINRTITYTISVKGGFSFGKASGTMLSVAHADGSMVNAPWNWTPAYAAGNVALDHNEYALTNELGQESIIRNGQWMMLPGGMHMEALKKGDIVLSAAQTEALIKTGRASGHGRAYAFGTLLASAYDRGSWNWTKDWSSPSTSSNSGSSKSGGSSGSSAGNNSSDNKDEEPEVFDWIELAIDRIERVIKQLGITAKSTFKTLTTRLEANAEEIATVTDEIELQQKAYDRYIQQANSVGLSEELAERVRNGAIDINEYDKETQKLIDDYQEWYEKALDCSDAVQQLQEDLAQLYEDRFNDTKDDFDAQLELLQHLTTTYENGMDDIEARGYLMTTKYYEAMRKVENKNIDLMNKELDALIEKMSQAVNSGAIKEGSQAWYEMQQEINDVKESIQEAETSVIELGNKIREVLWDRFDYLQDRISQINDESEFMIELLSHSDMHTDTGLFTNEGLATLGLHAQTYDVLMNKADRYAKEVEKINKEIANDPNNTILLEQRQEWIEAQRESILNAEDEKDAMISLVEDGIQLELDALNNLINKYKDSMDQAKSLYDYQKKINEQAQKVTSIQKQLRAYTGDDSEETRAITQKLTVDLSDAMEKLEESQYQKQISDQKAMLSNLYDAYELILNQRLDNVDALMSDLIQMVNLNSGATQESINALKEANGGYVNVINGQIYSVGGSNATWFDTLNGTARDGYGGVQNGVAVSTDSIINNDSAGYKSITDTLTSSAGSIYNANSDGYKSIKDTLNGAAIDVGYTISEEMKNIWSDSGNANRVVALYGDLVSSGLGTTNGKLDTVNEIIAGIATNVASMVQKSDAKATATVKATTSTTKTNTAAKPVTPAPTPTVKKTEAPKKTDGRTDQEKYGVAIAIWNGLQGWGAGQDRKNKLEAKGFNYNEIQGIVSKIKGDILSNTWSGKYYGITGNDISKYAYNKFKSGGIVDYTGLAQVDGTPGRPEAFLNAEDTKNFTILKDTLRAIMNGKASLSGSPVGLGLLSGLSGIGRPQGLRNSTIGDITYQINIPIDHVTDYDDFVNKMRSDTKFERLIQSMTIEQLTGQSSISKNKYKW